MRKLYIPNTGDRLVVAKDWTIKKSIFTLRDRFFRKLTGVRSRFDYADTHPGMTHLDIVVPAGTTFEVDCYSLKRGGSQFNSITVHFINSPDPRLERQYLDIWLSELTDFYYLLPGETPAPVATGAVYDEGDEA